MVNNLEVNGIFQRRDVVQSDLEVSYMIEVVQPTDSIQCPQLLFGDIIEFTNS